MNQSELAEELIERIGYVEARRVSLLAQGKPLLPPNLDELREARDRLIRKDRQRGETLETLVHKWQLTQRRISQILAKEKQS